jgi:nucleolar GTP-binding protein
MNLGGLGKVETAETYLDIAFARAKKHASAVKKSFKGSHFNKQKQREFDSVVTVRNTLSKHLSLIHDSFPKVRDLDPFYKELIPLVLDLDQFKKSLAAVKWANERIQAMHDLTNKKIRGAKDYEAMMKVKRAYYGRISSIIKQLKKDFKFLEEARKQLKVLPTIKTSLTTIAIAGFPNVGKTTLLKALTGSAPAIAHYPFTTQQIMMGYKTYKGNKLQFMDTPGILDRPLKKRNNIEKQAVLAMRHVANVIVFVIDPSESCGYTLKEQKSLLKETAKNFDIPIIVALNKMDLATEEQIEDASKNTQNLVVLSAQEEQNIRNLMIEIGKNLPTSSD